MSHWQGFLARNYDNTCICTTVTRTSGALSPHGWSTHQKSLFESGYDTHWQSLEKKKKKYIYTLHKREKASSACTTLGPTHFVLLSHLFIPFLAPPPQQNFKMLYPITSLSVCCLFVFIPKLRFHILLNFTTFCCLLHFAATKQSFYKFAHLLLHHSTLTLFYAILLNFYYACLYATLFNLATANHPSTILPIFCHTKLHSLSTFNYAMLYATPHNPSLSMHLSANTNLYAVTCCYAICYNGQFCLPETLYFAYSA